LRKLPEVKQKWRKDFAHSQAKLQLQKQKEQYPNRTLVACLELHTYSSLNAES
jgi:UDP-N-acetylmuramate: L-alanyl-gamma-D-glutamyl-meso-diaminopimelate ligase